VSPQNVLVGFNGSVKIIDFGVAKAAGKLSQTTAGQIKGKHAYMSPEQAKGESLDHRSDVFGLGTVFYELLTGLRLFKRESELATLKAVVSAKIAPPSEAAPGIPKTLDAVVLKALARNRDERFATAGDMQLAIEDFLFKQQQPSTTAHLAAFMREIYAAELEEELSTEPTIIAYDPRLPARKPPPPIVDPSAPTTLVPAHKQPPPEVPAQKGAGAHPLPKAPKVTAPPKANGAASPKDSAPKKSSRGGKDEK
jgi:serine/threonine-protein kinase